MTGTPWENSSAAASAARHPAVQVIERAGDPAAHRHRRVVDHRTHLAPDPASCAIRVRCASPAG
jgi:hypothetical protein